MVSIPAVACVAQGAPPSASGGNARIDLCQGVPSPVYIGWERPWASRELLQRRQTLPPEATALEMHRMAFRVRSIPGMSDLQALKGTHGTQGVPWPATVVLAPADGCFSSRDLHLLFCWHEVRR